MKIGLVGDIHLPRYWDLFKKAVENLDKDVEIIFFLGDLTDGFFMYIKKIYETVKKYHENIKIYSIFGNNEYLDYRDYLKKEFPFMNWIDDEVVKINNYNFIGTEGVLDEPTKWMEKNKPEIRDIWKKRLKKIEELLKNYKNTIVLSHYAPVLETTFGDPCPSSLLGSREFEKLILKYKPLYVFHAHSHYSKVWYKKVGETEVYNVSFPIHKKIFTIEI